MSENQPQISIAACDRWNNGDEGRAWKFRLMKRTRNVVSLWKYLKAAALKLWKHLKAASKIYYPVFFPCYTYSFYIGFTTAVPKYFKCITSTESFWDTPHFYLSMHTLDMEGF